MQRRRYCPTSSSVASGYCRRMPSQATLHANSWRSKAIFNRCWPVIARQRSICRWRAASGAMVADLSAVGGNAVVGQIARFPWGPKETRELAFSQGFEPDVEVEITQHRERRASNAGDVNPFGEVGKRKTPGRRHLGTGRLLVWRQNWLSCQSSPTRTRTLDPAVNSRLLYQLSYRGKRTSMILSARDIDKVASGRKKHGCQWGRRRTGPGLALGVERRDLMIVKPVQSPSDRSFSIVTLFPLAL